jgi:ATP-binding cassette subfamily F protein 3
MQKFVERFRYKATKARQAQSRLKMLERMEPIPAYQDEGGVTFAFPDPGPLPPPLYSIDNAAVGYDGIPVLTDLSLRLDADDRIALLGANGNGKSTLIKLLAGRLSPLSGDVVRSSKLRVGYFAQHQADELDLDVTPVVELGRKRPGEPEVRLRSHLGRFGFTQQRALTTIANLSGGEKARLLFALMTCDAPHILLLDEPTNHLDVDSRQALIQALTVFEGAVVIVTHDPHVIELTADRFWLIEDGRVEPFDGDMADYRSLLLGRGNGRNGASGNAKAADRNQGGPDKKEQRRLTAERRKALAPLKKRLTGAETAVHKLETEKAGLAKAMADPVLYRGDSAMLVDLKKQLGRVEKNLESAEETWTSAQEAWDQAQTEST